jgi:rSAM/selenodomain-associated transferase 1
MNAAQCRIVVMAKAPVAGHAKTRLIPRLGPEGAAQLAERLLVGTVEQAIAARIGAVELCCTPDASHPAFVRLMERGGLQLSTQGDGDLGARMARAVERALRAVRAVVLIGTDTPALDATYLRAARDALQRHDAVFGPAADGGYALVGLRVPAPWLFDGIPWSTSRVMSSTRERLEHSGLVHAELAPLHDIDEPGDLVHLPPRYRPGPARP